MDTPLVVILLHNLYHPYDLRPIPSQFTARLLTLSMIVILVISLRSECTNRRDTVADCGIESYPGRPTAVGLHNAHSVIHKGR
jgi:hypothetical protein